MKTSGWGEGGGEQMRWELEGVGGTKERARQAKLKDMEDEGAGGKAQGASCEVVWR